MHHPFHENGDKERLRARYHRGANTVAWLASPLEHRARGCLGGTVASGARKSRVRDTPDNVADFRSRVDEELVHAESVVRNPTVVQTHQSLEDVRATTHDLEYRRHELSNPHELDDQVRLYVVDAISDFRDTLLQVSQARDLEDDVNMQRVGV